MLGSRAVILDIDDARAIMEYLLQERMAGRLNDTNQQGRDLLESIGRLHADVRAYNDSTDSED